MKTLAGIPVAMLVLMSMSGCIDPSPPPPEAVLEGTWQLAGAVVQPGLTDFKVTFDQQGKMTALRYRLNDQMWVIVNDSSLIDSDSTVNGTDVSIIASWFQDNHFAFSGMLKNNNTLIDGNAAYRFVVGGSTIEASLGAGQLIKQ